MGLSTPEVALAPHRWPQDFRTEYRSDFEKDDAELQTCVGPCLIPFWHIDTPSVQAASG